MKLINTICASTLLLASVAPTAARVISTQNIIPAAYWGEWRPSLKDCGSTDEGMVMTITATMIGGFEAAGSVTRVIKLKAGGIKVFTDWEEGADPPEKWSDIAIFRLSDTGKTLTESSLNQKLTQKWRHCRITKKY